LERQARPPLAARPKRSDSVPSAWRIPEFYPQGRLLDDRYGLSGGRRKVRGKQDISKSYVGLCGDSCCGGGFRVGLLLDSLLVQY
jgi:hypothetical protein